MERESFIAKSGKDWSFHDREAAWAWIEHTLLDNLIKIAFGRIAPAFPQHAQYAEQVLEAAKDVVAEKLQEIFLHRLHTYEPTHYKGTTCPLRNWLCCLVARAASKHAQKLGRHQAQLQRLQQQAARQQAVPRACPPLDTALDWEQLWTPAQPFLEQLPPKYRDAIKLCCKDGLPRAEAARQAGCTINTLKVRLHRARHMVRALMQAGEWL